MIGYHNGAIFEHILYVIEGPQVVWSMFDNYLFSHSDFFYILYYIGFLSGTDDIFWVQMRARIIFALQEYQMILLLLQLLFLTLQYYYMF